MTTRSKSLFSGALQTMFMNSCYKEYFKKFQRLEIYRLRYEDTLLSWSNCNNLIVSHLKRILCVRIHLQYLPSYYKLAISTWVSFVCSNFHKKFIVVISAKLLKTFTRPHSLCACSVQSFFDLFSNCAAAATASDATPPIQLVRLLC